MAKRTLGNPDRAAISTIVKGTYKRQRTDEYLESTANFESVMETCRFFETHISASPCIDGHELRPTSSEVKDSLKRQMIEFETKHHVYCLQMKQLAKNAIQLTDSFQILSTAIDARTDSSVLTLMNLGPDTTEFFKQHISDFAGVPTPNMLVDCRNLESLLR